MLRTEYNWEDKGWSRLSNLIFKDDGSRGFRMVEVTSPVRYHVDVRTIGAEDSQPLHHCLLLNDLADVLQLIGDNNSSDLRISIQSPFDEFNGYVISLVSEIVQISDENGYLTYICTCEDQRTYSAPFFIRSEKFGRDQKTVWSRLA